MQEGVRCSFGALHTVQVFLWLRVSGFVCRVMGSLGTRPSKNRKGGSGISDGVEVYTAPGMQAHFRLAFD